MVAKRRLNRGSNGFSFPNIPKAPRSSRRKVSSKKGDVDNQISAIDLLASLAGKLLEESESSSTSTYAFEEDKHDHVGGDIKQDHEDVYNKLCKSQFSDLASKPPIENTSLKCLQFSSLENDCKKASGSNRLVGCENKKEDCNFVVESGGLSEETGVVGSSEQGDTTEDLENSCLIADTFSLKDSNQLYVKFPGSVHQDCHVKLPLGMDGVRNGCFEGYENHSKLACRDDEENYCKYYKFNDKCKSYRPLTWVGNRRIKESVMTKCGRAFPRSKCFEDTSRTDGCLKAYHRKRKFCYGYNTWKHETVHRKRRLSKSDKGLVVVNSEGGLSSESVSNSPVKGESEIGVFSAAIGLHLKDSRVKFSIKSLRIPELFIEVPETATVGSLKRAVMEAVTALLGDEIRIGVLVQGKKVRDDNNTLSQTGLSCTDNLGNLGFTLEPGPKKQHVPICMPTGSTSLSERFAASPALDSRITVPLQDEDDLIHSGKRVENSHELVPYQSDISADEPPVSALESDALAIVAVNTKRKRTELSQRRTRRPFSVTEVEALVQAVEELGTGRWRDVKLRSFESSSHRTYVDLKDKWKTLVHTASISPQQRRGESVPQELLDRVLSAHRCWSQHQPKPSVESSAGCNNGG